MTIRPLAYLLVLALSAAACGGSGPADGAPAADLVPDAAVETFDGEATTVHAFLGEPLVINFWASWCAPCVAEMPDFQTVSQEFDGRVRFLGIDTQDGIVPARRLIEETGVTYDLVRDEDAAAFRAFGIRGMPSTFLVAPDGELVKRHTGPLTAEALRELIEQHLLGGAARP